ncbi:hypothetical protein F4553_004905 [Allocatelliglobosispora scoriae]|uniref:DUF1023 domain-containing protein n=1 Tax=Allocatelliglobosispora scoriae TaxID=643052 RepID=A0A841BVM6_9ACTN|nr:alpha/beta hydrolase [Allocatelliglobosispora scoriae]MBB5871526.1 hypothetical protein [Allocatelliglobosispora scoriae]
MITFARLASADIDAWRSAGDAWRRLAASVGDGEAHITGSGQGLRADWAGPAATAATAQVAAIGADLAALRVPLTQIQQVLATHAEAIERARRLLIAGVDGVEDTRVVVTAEGRVELDVRGAPPAPWEAALAARTAERISAALTMASRADAETSRALSELAKAAETHWTEAPPSCPPGGGAGAVRLWWSGLTPAQRRWLIAHQPDVIGSLDGVPAADRDLANREWLSREHARLSGLRDALHGKRGAEDELARIESRLAGLSALERRLDGGEPRGYLLGLDTRGDGRVILALGDPDRSDNVLTYVPGAGSELNGGVAGLIDRTATMSAAATAADPTLSTSSILWLDFDSPDAMQATSAAYAHAAQHALHDFQQGLTITHDGEIGQQTLVGHSYGSLVIGETARDRGVAADDLVFLGSAGVGVDHAADLHLDPGAVWSSHARHDPIQLAAPNPLQAALDQMLGPYLGDPMTRLWHGVNPSDTGFGGHRFTSADGGELGHAHSSYWDSGNPGLAAVGAIASGHDDRLK